MGGCYRGRPGSSPAPAHGPPPPPEVFRLILHKPGNTILGDRDGAGSCAPSDVAEGRCWRDIHATNLGSEVRGGPDPPSACHPLAVPLWVLFEFSPFRREMALNHTPPSSCFSSCFCLNYSYGRRRGVCSGSHLHLGWGGARPRAPILGIPPQHPPDPLS